MNELDNKELIHNLSKFKTDKSYYEIREKAYCIVAYFAVSLSLCAILAIFITLPIVNNYVNNIYYRAQHEMDFCKVNKNFCF